MAVHQWVPSLRANLHLSEALGRGFGTTLHPGAKPKCKENLLLSLSIGFGDTCKAHDAPMHWMTGLSSRLLATISGTEFAVRFGTNAIVSPGLQAAGSRVGRALKLLPARKAVRIQLQPNEFECRSSLIYTYTGWKSFSRYRTSSVLHNLCQSRRKEDTSCLPYPSVYSPQRRVLSSCQQLCCGGKGAIGLQLPRTLARDSIEGSWNSGSPVAFGSL